MFPFCPLVTQTSPVTPNGAAKLIVWLRKRLSWMLLSSLCLKYLPVVYETNASSGRQQSFKMFLHSCSWTPHHSDIDKFDSDLWHLVAVCRPHGIRSNLASLHQALRLILRFYRSLLKLVGVLNPLAPYIWKLSIKFKGDCAVAIRTLWFFVWLEKKRVLL